MERGLSAHGLHQRHMAMTIPFEWRDSKLRTRLKLELPQKRLMLTPTRELERVSM